MLDALPSDMHQALEQSLRQAMQEGIPQSVKALMPDQSQNTVQRLTGLREQLEKQEQNQQTEITVRHYHCDHLGTPIALTDEQQNVVWAARLDPWGNVEQEFNPHDIEQSIRLPGQHDDKETGLYYNRHRYYDPSIGAYINQDPIGLEGGINKSSYSLNDPIAFYDPNGLAVPLLLLGVFALGGAGIGVGVQYAADKATGSQSGWEDYAGAAVGGGATCAALLYGVPVAAGAAGGAAGNFTKQGLKMFTQNQSPDVASFAVDTAVGAATGFIPGPKISGITAGRNSMNAIFKSNMTKLNNGTINNVSNKSVGKMFLGRTTDAAMLPGTVGGSAASTVYNELTCGNGCK